MITLNLLSPYKKGRLAQLIKFLFIKEILEILILTTSLLAVTYLCSWLILNDFLSDLSQSTTLVNKSYSTFNREIVRVNRSIKEAALASKDFYPLTPKLTELINNLPADIKINFLDVSRFNNTLALSGVAKTRDALISYQNKLSQLTWLTTPRTPPSQLLEKENVSFEIRASLVGIPALTSAPNKK